MTITAISALASLATTSTAIYTKFDPSAIGTGDAAKTQLISDLQNKSLNGGFTADQAKAFADQYTLLDRQPNVPFNGFSAAVFQDKVTRQKVFALRGTEVELSGQLLTDLLNTDGLSIAGNGFANNQAVEMVRYYRRLTTVGGQLVAYTNDQAWQLFAMANSLIVPAASVVPVLSLAMAASFSAFKTALQADTGVVVEGKPGESVLSASDKLDVTGHSLGGHLALLFARIFPQATHEVVTLNAPGLFPQGNSFLTSIGFPPTGNGNITRIEADGDGVSEIGTLWPGLRIRIAQENQSGLIAAITGNHSSVNGVDGLNLMAVLAKLDTGKANNAVALSDLLRAGSNGPDNTYENILDAMRKQLLGINITATPVSTGASDPNRTDLYKNMDDLVKSDAFKALAGKATLTLATSSLATTAKTDFAAFLSLNALSPVVISTTDAAAIAALKAANPTLSTAWTADSNARQYGDTTKVFDYSDNWYADRAAMLSVLVDRNKTDQAGMLIPNPAQGLLAGHYTDKTSNTDMQVGISTTTTAQIAFGGADADELNGLGSKDRLYGGAGNDTLDGKAGDDYLEGGVGSDTYQFSGSWGKDTVVDAGGEGKLQIDGNVLSGGKKLEGSDKIWISEDDKYRYVLQDNGDLIVQRATGSDRITLKGWQNNQLGINLEGAPKPPKPVPMGPSIFNGDQRAKLIGTKTQASIPATDPRYGTYAWNETSWATDGTLTGGVGKANFFGGNLIGRAAIATKSVAAYAYSMRTRGRFNFKVKAIGRAAA